MKPTMANYYLNHNAQQNGDHEVHKSPCVTVSSFVVSNMEYLGSFASCHSAVNEARRRHLLWKINGCYFCSAPCHTT